MSSITNLISVGVNGTGTANSVMKWLDADTATDSSITDDGTTVTITGDVSIADKIIHTGDTDTAIRFLAADTVTVETAGSEKLRVSPLGTVGVNTGLNNAVYKFAVNTGTDLNLAIGSQSGEISIEAFNDAINASIPLRMYGTPLQFYTNGSERMRISSTGNVGIGTTPTGKLTVSNTSGGTTPSNYIQVLGSTADNSNYPAIELKGGTLANSFPAFSLTNGGLSTVISAGYHSTNYNNRASMTLQGGDGSVIISTGTSGTSSERVRISSGGEIFATSDLNVGLSQGITASAGTTFAIFVGRHSSTAGNTSSGINSFIVWSNGNVVNTNNSYGAISDIKTKENIVDATPKLDDLLKVKVRNFNYIGDENKQLGVVAQELEEVFPSMIDESPDYEEREVEVKDEEGNIVYKTEQVLVSEAVLDEEANVIEEAVYETVVTNEPEMTTERVDLGTTTKSVKYSVFVPILIKAMQEQQEIINDLKARIETLENK